jgi:hypothetical protein
MSNENMSLGRGFGTSGQKAGAVTTPELTDQRSIMQDLHDLRLSWRSLMDAWGEASPANRETLATERVLVTSQRASMVMSQRPRTSAYLELSETERLFIDQIVFDAPRMSGTTAERLSGILLSPDADTQA